MIARSDDLIISELICLVVSHKACEFSRRV